MSKELYVTRPYKEVYRDGDVVVKVFKKEHGKANVFNEALCHARAEEAGVNVPEVLEVCKIGEDWAIKIQYVEGKTLAEIMKEDPENLETYMNQFVDLQVDMHKKKAPRLTEQKPKFQRKISSLRGSVDATIRYELHTRLDVMPNHDKLCHGDFNPSNVIVKEDGTMVIVDWAHATIGNASGDAAVTYLEFAREDQKLADLYLKLFCQKSDIAKQYVQKWIPIAAAVQLSKGIEDEKEFLYHWMDVMDFE